VKFVFIAKHRGIWAVDWMCGALGVSRGGFYAWLTRLRSRRSRSNEELGAKVRASFIASDRTYGARRVWHDMRSTSDRTIDAATGSQSSTAPASTAARFG
jgi:putative transposase